jgi:hypothetical protein
MNEIERTHHRHGGPHEGSAQEGQRPYWKRAHRDWRVWVGLFFMFAAIIIYVLSEDLAWMPTGRPQRSVAGAAGKPHNSAR